MIASVHPPPPVSVGASSGVVATPPHDETLALCRQRLGMVIDNKYELRDLLGYGASGAVYRAQNRWAGRPCAVKIFHYEGEGSQLVLQRFIREAQAINRVKKNGKLHPNVVDAIDVGRDRTSGFYFIVQELLQGETLARRLLRETGRRLALHDALAILRPVFDAIACAHDAGIVHRDLKPENIFLLQDGETVTPKVLDFGIAQLSDERITPVYDLMGTPQYMPPEAFGGAGYVDARADVWALAVILYEAVSGICPFEADSGDPSVCMERVLQTDPPSLAAMGLVPNPVWYALRRALAKIPSQRYPHARAFDGALQRALKPVRVLRVPSGMKAQALKEALHDPVRYAGMVELQRAGSMMPPAMDEEGEGDEPEAEQPSHFWWSVMFHMTDHTPAEMIEVLGLPELAQLVELHVVGVPLGTRGLTALLDSPYLSNLAVLSLRRAGITSFGANELAMSHQISSLVKLDLEENPIGPDGLAALLACPQLDGLRALNLVQTDLDPSAGRALATSPLVGHLQRLDLSQNALGDDGARALAVSPWVSSGLWLTLARNQVSRPVADVVTEALRGRVRKLVM